MREEVVKFDIEVQFFAAMHPEKFGQYVSHSLGQMLRTRGQGILHGSYTQVFEEPFVEPDRPGWFDGHQAEPLKAIVKQLDFEADWGTRFHRKVFFAVQDPWATNADFTSNNIFRPPWRIRKKFLPPHIMPPPSVEQPGGPSVPEPDSKLPHLVNFVVDGNNPQWLYPPELYCETNTSTQLLLRFEVTRDQYLGDREGMVEETVPLSTYQVKRLALVLLAFESEIDQLLPDHAGYVTESASALSNRANPKLRPLSDKGKLDRIWHDCHTADEVIDTMCPPINDQAAYPKHPGWRSHYKYNFLPLRVGAHAPHIEFRQHHGTLDSRAIVPWVYFVGSLFHLALYLDEVNLLRLVHLDDTAAVSLVDLFHTMMWTCPKPIGLVHQHESNLLDMIVYYSRKSMARGGSSRMRDSEQSWARVGRDEDGGATLTWRAVKAGEFRRRGEEVGKR